MPAELHLGAVEDTELVACDGVDGRPFFGCFVRQLVGVEVSQDEEYAQRALGVTSLDRRYAAGGDRAVGGRRVNETRWMKLGRVLRGSGNFCRPIDATERFADRTQARAPVSSMARVTVRRINSIL